MRSFCLLLACVGLAQAETVKEEPVAPAIPGSDIHMFEINNSDSVPSLSNGINITNSPGYDSQPHFSENGDLVYYTRIREGQADVFEYVIKEAINRPYLRIPKRSEYSPTPIPGGPGLSVIQVDEQGDQYLVKINNRSKLPPERFSDLKQVGYHNWTHNRGTHLWTFILNDNNGGDLYHQGQDKKATKIKDNIGRSFIRGNDHKTLYFVDKNHKPWQIHAITHPKEPSQKVMDLPAGTEDFTHDRKGRFWAGQGNNLFVSLDQKNWTLIQSFPDKGTISRVTTNPKADKIAIVFAEQ